MQCTLNGKIFQYEIGKEYKEDKADLCHCGFHACENPLDVLSYYNNIDDKFCEVELDKIDPNRNKDSKICGKKIKIGIEIGFLGLFKAGIEWIKNKTIFTKEDFKKLPSSYNAKISSSDYNARIGSFSDYARIGSSGEYAQIGSSGDDCVIMCAGINSSAKAKIGSWITLAEWKYSKEKQRDIPFSVVTKQVDGIEIKEDVYYTLQDGKFKESKQH
jgi:hypothetical protein